MPLSSRKRLELALLALPDEAFSYVALAIFNAPPAKHDAIWPDGRGGFLPESQDAITAAEKAASDYVAAGGK